MEASNNLDLPQVELGQDSKDLLESTKSTIHGVKDDIEDVAQNTDYSKMTLQQLQKEFHAFRKEHEVFRFEVRKLIADEIAKQVQPLVEQLDTFISKKPKIVYIKWKSPFRGRVVYFVVNVLDFLWYCIKRIIKAPLDLLSLLYGKILI